jgi:hypothetical protein
LADVIVCFLLIIENLMRLSSTKDFRGYEYEEAGNSIKRADNGELKRRKWKEFRAKCEQKS